MDDAIRQISEDLTAEQDVVFQVLKTLTPDAWDRPSPADGWTLRDCVVHLAETDAGAAAAIEGRTAPVDARGRGAAGDRRIGVLTQAQRAARGLSPDEVVASYSDAAKRLRSALNDVSEGERIPWAGRGMSARSFATARLMEHWSHGLDILDTAGVSPVDTDRLRHVAHLGYITREFAYRNRGLPPPSTSLYLELVAPSGAIWTWGPLDAPDRIFGPAGDFCRVVTQRIHLSDTSLRCEGPQARQFLTIAQAFAGPPGAGRPPKAGP